MLLFSSKEEPGPAQMQKDHVGLEADINGPSNATHGHDYFSCSVGIGNWILSSLYVVFFHFHIKVGKRNSNMSIFVSVVWVFLCGHTHLGLLQTSPIFTDSTAFLSEVLGHLVDFLPGLRIFFSQHLTLRLLE